MNIEKQTGFDLIKEKWMELTLTDSAKERIKNLSFYLSESELRKQIKDTSASKELIEKLGAPPLQNASIIKELLMIAEKGDCLTPQQLEQVETILAAFKRLKNYLKKGMAYDNSLAFYEENLYEMETLREEIGRQIRAGNVVDDASKELRRVRSQLIKYKEQMKEKAEQILRSNRAYMADSYCAFRNGRLCLPVKKEYKHKITGGVIDKSATGSTLFIEPTAIANYDEKLQILKINEENELYRILYALTAMVAESAALLRDNIKMTEKLDFIFSKGKLSIDLDAVEPVINVERRISLIDARCPLMDRSVNVPLQFEIGTNARGVIITGPNTGGKTVAIKTVALNCMMAQCGLHVTCKEAEICMSDSYLCDIGDGQNIAENLSTFSAHIGNVLQALREVSADSFVIMDELGSGTDPTEGMGIAIAVLEELRKSGAIFLITTHYPEIKEYAQKTDGIVNAKMTFDRQTLMPTYQMIIGEAGESCAFYIADRLGMPTKMLKTAIRAAYGEQAVREWHFQNRNAQIEKKTAPKIKKCKKMKKKQCLQAQYQRGDSVMIYPDKKIGIVCEPINEKGVLRVQLANKKIWINHKRVKLHVAAARLYPEDYDFSIIFDTVENRKALHDMKRKYTEKTVKYEV